MLSEHFIAALGVPLKPPGTNVAKDAAIFLHEYQPLQQQRAVFKKSASAPNCLAVSETHVFAAQIDKGVVHVYNREKGNHEATVPFTERISTISLACDNAVLILGTQEGRIFLWETCTGRLVTTNQFHLQPVTALAVDPASNFLLSASKDSTIHVWSIPALLSLASLDVATPLRTFSSHHTEVTSLVLGHSSSHCNFAVSFSSDRTCLVWDYRTNHVLRTYLLPAVPFCAALDPADRAVYVGYEDGNVQSLDLYTTASGDLAAVQTGKDSATPIPASNASLWNTPDATYGPALSLSVSYDGSSVITGHQSGNILNWDVARGLANEIGQSAFHAPVTNVFFLPVTGFRNGDTSKSNIRITDIVKPKFGALSSSEPGAVPANYNMQVHFTNDLSTLQTSFSEALTAPIFPDTLLDQGLTELASWGKNRSQSNDEIDDDFMALDGLPQQKRTIEQENAELKAQLEAIQNVQKKVFEKMTKLGEEKRALLRREQKRSAKRAATGQNGQLHVDDEDDDSSD